MISMSDSRNCWVSAEISDTMGGDKQGDFFVGSLMLKWSTVR